ncbi:MAG: rod shape-determining protein MreD [Bacteroidales bacterium]|nr:rod shape-determining protein MreD [Bacteroidales bacterium]
MYNTLIKNILTFIGLLLLQVLVFDNIRFGNFIHPVIYVLFIMVLPFKTPHWRLILNGFLMGIVIDIFDGTPGLNAAATTLAAYLRPYVIGIMTRKSELEKKEKPTVELMGFSWFLVYSLIILFFHNFAFFLLEAFSFKLSGVVFLEILISVPVSAFVILLILYLFKPIKKNKNL